MPKLASNKTALCSKGITAQPKILIKKTITGAPKCNVLLAKAGVITSLKSNLKASAKGCNKPKKPTN